MKLFFLLSGLLLLIGGVLLIFLPGILIKLGDKINRMTLIDDFVFFKRYVFGLLLLLTGIYLIYTYLLS